MDLTALNHMAAAVIFGLAGLCTGSFLNAVIFRLPNHMSLFSPPPHCPECGCRLRWYDTLPIVSCLISGGKCRECGAAVSPRRIIAEVLNMLLWLLCLHCYGFSGLRNAVMTLSAAFACSVCICIAAIDWEHKLIYDRFQLILLVLAAAFVLADEEASFASNLLCAAVTFGVIYLIGWLVTKKTGREALGGGDIKFAFVSALFLGWDRVLLMWLLASVSALVLIGLRRAGTGGNQKERAEFPFGPFLVFGWITALLAGEKIIAACSALFGI